MVCVRIRGYVSLELDGELSELETSILESHVTDCAACASFRHSVSEVTAALRSAPVEAAGPSFRAPTRRSRLLSLPASAGASAAAAVAAAAVVVAGFTSVLAPPDTGPASELRTTAASADEPVVVVAGHSPRSMGASPGQSMRVL